MGDPGLLDPINWIPIEKAINFGNAIYKTWKIVSVAKKGKNMITRFQLYNKVDDYFWQAHWPQHGKWLHW